MSLESHLEFGKLICSLFLWDQGHISTLEGQLDAQSNGASTALSQMVDSLREELRRKTDALDYQQNRIKELIVQWEDNSEVRKTRKALERVVVFRV